MAALTKEMVPMVVGGGASARVEADIPARFKVGDRVTVLNINPPTHTRMPRYVRGKTGTVEIDHGVFVYPDASAHGQEKPQRCYSVRFAAQDLWGAQANARDSLNIDMFDDYIEKA